VTGTPALRVCLADSEADVRAAQRLRWAVFAEEMGARLDSPEPGLDIDAFDAHCDHLLVRERRSGEVVGTYRLLGPDAARRIGGSYGDQAFDLGRLAPMRGRTVELGRSCVHAAYRRGAVVLLLWMGVAEYMRRHRHDVLFGCASIPVGDGRYDAARIWSSLVAPHLSAPAWWVLPRRPFPMPALAPPEPGAAVPMPPLVRAYLRAGARVCGEPAWDPDFHCADLPMLLPLERLDPAYARHFLHAADGGAATDRRGLRGRPATTVARGEPVAPAVADGLP